MINNKVILYSTPTCPKCKVIEAKLQKKGYDVIREMNEEVIINKGLMSVPWIEYEGKLYDFTSANKLIKELPEVEV